MGLVDPTLPRFGCHLSTAGGLERALLSATELDFQCVQLFVKNQRQWQSGPLEEEQIRVFTQVRGASSVAPIVAHASYLVNLASPDATARHRSMSALLDEVERCDALDIPLVVVHPGASLGESEATALKLVAESLDEIAKRRTGHQAAVLLESTAGQGTSIGHRLEHLAEIRTLVRNAASVGVCLDTCHLFAAGYDFRHPDQYAALAEEIDRTVGFSAIQCIHLNDSKRELGSRVDRHEHIGKGMIGEAGFAHFVNDPRLLGIPMILETPKGTDDSGVDYDRTNLSRLRSLLR